MGCIFTSASADRANSGKSRLKDEFAKNYCDEYAFDVLFVRLDKREFSPSLEEPYQTC